MKRLLALLVVSGALMATSAMAASLVDIDLVSSPDDPITQAQTIHLDSVRDSIQVFTNHWLGLSFYARGRGADSTSWFELDFAADSTLLQVQDYGNAARFPAVPAKVFSLQVSSFHQICPSLHGDFSISELEQHPSQPGNDLETTKLKLTFNQYEDGMPFPLQGVITISPVSSTSAGPMSWGELKILYNR